MSIAFLHTTGDFQITYNPTRKFSDLLSSDNLSALNQYWREQEDQRSRPMGCLLDTGEGVAVYGQTEYKEFDAACKGIVPAFGMRIASTVIALRTGDDKTIIQRRSLDVLAGGKLDGSASGMIPMKDGAIIPGIAIYEKLSRELGLDKDSLEDVLPTGLFTCDEFPSSIATFSGKTPLSYSALQDQANPDYVHELVAVANHELPDFLIESYLSGDLIGDGAGTFLLGLNPELREETIEKLRKAGKEITHQFLSDGRLISQD